MIHHKCVQGSEEWLRLRRGMPTASEFDSLITPKKGEPTKGEKRSRYLAFLLAECILDMPLSGVTTAAMDHGHDWEPKARSAYEMARGTDVELCGFCTNDAMTIGASPDGFVSEYGSIEIKCPEKPEIHVSYLINPMTLVEEYWCQVQGQLFVTGRKWTDMVSYFSGLPMVTARVLPDEEFQKKLGAALDSFVADFAVIVTRAKERGWLPADYILHPEPEAPKPVPDGLSDEDLEFHLSRLREASK